MSFCVDYGSMELKEVFTLVEDPRKSRGKIYTLEFLLNCTQSAILSGAKGFRQVGEWIENQSFDHLKILGNKFCRRPDESTLRKCFKKLNIHTFKDLCYKWSAKKCENKGVECDAIAIDGKTLKASRNYDNRQPHILSAVSHEHGITLGEQLVPNKTSEVQSVEPLLSGMNIAGKTITADALHTISSFGEYIVSRGGNYVFIAKGNKKKLIDRFRLLDIPKNHWSMHETREKSHGRLEVRRVYLVSELPWWFWFKSAQQGFVIERERTVISTGKTSFEQHFGLTNLTDLQANAEEILGFIRGHWVIENKSFHVRDRAFSEDQSRVSSGILPEFMTVMRNLAINVLRFEKTKNISQGLRKCHYNPRYCLKLLGAI